MYSLRAAEGDWRGKLALFLIKRLHVILGRHREDDGEGRMGWISGLGEKLLLSITFRHVPFSLVTFYRPPSCPDDLCSLHSVLTSLAHSYSHNLILLGDFNVNYLSPSPLLNQLHVISDLFSLDQIVAQPTHFSPSGTPSPIDLVFVPSSFSSYSCNVLPPISNSDHYSILFSLPLPATSSPAPSSPSTSHRVWLYHRADTLTMNELLSSIPWTSILSTTDVNHSWQVLNILFLRLCTSPFLVR